jgi:kynurenine--oxoglutarate transaminase/cysteine-S-conjugate beta-lyase/glutamine--phenylpyruvate transaminase
MSNVGHGDEVIIIEPAFDCYQSLVHLAGGTAVFVPLRHTCPEDQSCAAWKLDKEELRSLFNAKTKAIVINTPNNPMGKIFSKEELTEIRDLCIEFNVLVISDEVYEWAVFEGKEHVRIASLDSMWMRTITIGSVGKTFGLTGYRLGWAYGPPHLIQNLQVASSNCTYTLDTLSQEVIARIFELELPRIGTPDSIFYRMTKDLKKRRDVMIQTVTECGMKPIIPDAGIFLIANWRCMGSEIDLSKETGESADYKFVKWLVREKKLLGIPPSLFYSPSHKHVAEDYIRFCFYRKNETLQKANEILKNWCQDSRALQLK